MTTIPLFSIRRASKSYNGIPALIDAELDLQAGEVHALIGENGAGKSTLIKLLAGVLSADSLDISLNRQSVHIHSPQGAFQAGLRFIHQELNIIPQLSVAENIFLSQPYPSRLGVFVDWSSLNRRAKAVLERLGVGHIRPRQVMARLSPGDQMLVKIAAAFVGDEVTHSRASVYILDEPTAALTGEEAARLFHLIENLQEHGCAILYVSHRLDEIFQIAQHVTVLRNGRVVGSHSIADVTTADLIRLMTGRELEQVYPPRTTPLTDETLFSVRGLSNATLQDVDFEIRRGEILGVAGLIGAGRTELLRGLMGVDGIQQGEIQLEGRPFKPSSPVSAWRQGVAFVPEERRSQGVILSQSVRRNMILPHLAGLFLRRFAELKRTTQLGESVQLKVQNVEQHVWQLSGGNQQKVVFGRALGGQLRLLLLDEPTRGVDVGAKFDLYQLIRRSSREGAGVLMVSSELTELLGICDRILVLKAGRVVDIVSAVGLTEEKLLALCYGESMHESN